MYERHGQTAGGQPRLYRIWRAMRFRCTNDTHSSYSRYGGRGIRVCPEWDTSFVAFRIWALSHGYAEDLTIDRKDNDGDYTPDNCRWATIKEQGLNKSGACLVNVNGVTKSVCKWSKETGIHLTTLYRRYQKGISGPEFLKKPIPKPKPISLEYLQSLKQR